MHPLADLKSQLEDFQLQLELFERKLKRSDTNLTLLRMDAYYVRGSLDTGIVTPVLSLLLRQNSASSFWMALAMVLRIF